MTAPHLTAEERKLVRRICAGPRCTGKYPETITTAFPRHTRLKIESMLTPEMRSYGWSIADFVRLAVEHLIANPGLEAFDFPPETLFDGDGKVNDQ